jgi:Flp pilus assembly protein TadG
MNMKALKIGNIARFIHRDEGGGALVETALTLPLLVMMIAGAAEFSRVAYASLEVVSAAKAGVSYGAQTGGTTGALNQACSNSHLEQTLTVVTQATIDPLIHLPGLPTTYTINGQASQLCLQ